MASDPALARLLAVLHPSELALRDWVAPQLDASMMDEIATADYGVDAGEHRHAIEELRRARRLPNELSWHPEEVLALTRWSTVDGSQLSLAAARRLHLMRLVCCLVLVRATTTYGPAQHTGHGVLLARLGQAIRGDLAADAAELRSLLVSGAER